MGEGQFDGGEWFHGSCLPFELEGVAANVVHFDVPSVGIGFEHDARHPGVMLASARVHLEAGADGKNRHVGFDFARGHVLLGLGGFVRRVQDQSMPYLWKWSKGKDTARFLFCFSYFSMSYFPAAMRDTSEM